MAPLFLTSALDGKGKVILIQAVEALMVARG
jgi:hypothetical protein